MCEYPGPYSISVTKKKRHFAVALHQEPDEMMSALSDAPTLKDVLPDTTVYWTGYPFSRQPIPARMNLLLQQRYTLTMFVWEVWHLSRQSGVDGSESFSTKAEFLGERLGSWYRQLPDALHYASGMPPAYHDFQYSASDSTCGESKQANHPPAPTVFGSK